MRRVWTRFIVGVGCANAVLLVAWITIGHQVQTPLPRLLYSHNGVQSLYVWEADCPSLLVNCIHDRMLLEGLNMHPVAQWSPDGAFIAVYLSESWAIYPADCLLSDKPCTPWRLDPEANDIRIAWGPGGTTLAYITNSTSATMKILTRGCWDESGQQCLEQTVPVASKGVLRQPTWSADGSRFAFLGLQPRGLFVLDGGCLDAPDSCTDKIRYVRVNSLWPVYWPSLSADGGQLLFWVETADGIEQLYRTWIDSGKVEQLTFRAGGGSVPAWSSDGRYIAFAGFQNQSGGDLGIYLFDMERGLTALAIHQRGEDFAYPAWSPRP